MKENVWSQILSGGLIVVSLSLLAGCQSSLESQAARQAQTELSQTANISPNSSRKVEITATVDPADRKFFNPGYGIFTARSDESRTLSTIDPADRKFFNPGYGAYASRNDLTAYHQSEWGSTPTTGLSLEDLRKIDPADRKFFNPGYGAYATPKE